MSETLTDEAHRAISAKRASVEMPDNTGALKNAASSLLRSASSPSQEVAIKAAWDAYVDAAMDERVSNLEAMAAAIDAYHAALTSP